MYFCGHIELKKKNKIYKKIMAAKSCEYGRQYDQAR